MPASSPLLSYVASPNMEAPSSSASLSYAAPGAKAAAAPSAGLISSPPVMPSLLTGLASSPAIGTAQAPAIVMPPGLRPPPGNGPLTLALPVGAPHLRIPARRQLPYQRPANYQPDYAGYYGYKNTRTDRRHNPLSYRSSQYPQKQWYSNRFYPASSYPRRGVASANTFQRRYRQTDHKRSTNQGTVNNIKIPLFSVLLSQRMKTAMVNLMIYT